MDLTDKQWRLIEPLIPKRKVTVRIWTPVPALA